MRVSKTGIVAAPLSKVWAAMNDWGGIWKFQPWVSRSPLLSPNNEGVGASRRCEFVDNTSIVETVAAIVPERSIEMTLSEAPKPMKSGTSIIRFEPKGEQTEVTVEIDVALGMGILNPIIGNLMMKPMMKSRVAKMLKSLEYHLQTGGKIDSKGNQLDSVRVAASQAR